jgi:hypothetical protein
MPKVKGLSLAKMIAGEYNLAPHVIIRKLDEIERILDELIMATPTSELRNAFTDVNIAIMGLKSRVKGNKI